MGAVIKQIFKYLSNYKVEKLKKTIGDPERKKCAKLTDPKNNPVSGENVPLKRQGHAIRRDLKWYGLIGPDWWMDYHY
jgi:hypothetical protein